MRCPPLSTAEHAAHTPLALELREIARHAPDGELALRAATDYLLARIAGIFEAHPRLVSLGYQPAIVGGEASLTGLVKITSPPQDAERPQVADTNANAPTPTGRPSSHTPTTRCCAASSAPKPATKPASAATK